MNWADGSIVVTPVRITTPFSNTQNVQDLFGAVSPTAEPELTNTEFFVGRTLQGFEVVRWVSPFVGNYLVEFAGDAVTSVIVETSEIPPRRIG